MSGGADTTIISGASRASGTSNPISLTCSNIYSDLLAQGLGASTAYTGSPTTLLAVIANIGAAATPTGLSFNNLFQITDASSGAGNLLNNVPLPAPLSNLSVGASKSVTIKYTFPAAGTYSVRACANKSSAGSFSAVDEGGNTTNNCSGWADLVVSAPNTNNPGSVAPTLTLSAKPNRVRDGGTTQIIWSAPDADACALSNTVTNDVLNVGLVGTSTQTIIGQTAFTLTCLKAGVPYSINTTVRLVPRSIER